LKIQALETFLLRYALDRPVGGSGVSAVDVLIAQMTVDSDAQGIQGLGFSYVLSGSGLPALAAAREMASGLIGQTLHHPQALWQQLAAQGNRTRRGPNYIALAALDVAAWDAWSCAMQLPLGVALGGKPRAVAVYGSGGFNPRQSPAEAAAAARQHVARGLRAVKPRVGGSASSFDADAALLRAVREVLPAGTSLMLDANEKASASSAHRLCALASDLGALWVEEPLPADDLAGHAALSARWPGLLASGEHLQGQIEALPFLQQRALGVFQPDLAAMGGLSECLRCGHLAEAFGVEVSPHFLPGLFVHLAAALPGLRWLEDFPLLEPLFEGWPHIDSDGMMRPRDVRGHGLRLADGVREMYRIAV
jgi:L-alanine-DL-glutamate epimerase-like enolase superfamily enzyme